MAITVKHSKVSTIPDGTDTTVVRPSDWNDDHVLTGTIPVANGGTGASTLTGYVKGNGTAAMTASATVPSTDVTGLGTMSTQNSNNIVVTGGSMSGVTISDYVATATKGVANGVASLDGSGTVPIAQLPAAVLGALSYQGTWNASTNTPTLTSSVGTKGYYYVVNVAGSTNLNGITDWQIGDWAVFNGSVWQKIDNTDAVTSVNGYTGTVVLGYSDITTGVVPIANGGTNSTAPPIAGGVGYGTGTALAYSAVGSSGQFLQSNGSGTPTWANVTSNVGSVGYYGSYFDTSTVTATSTTTAYVMNIGTVDIQNGVSIVGGTKVTVANAGVYNLQFSAQLSNPNAAIADVSVWFRVNGVDITDGAGTNGVPAKHGANNGLQIIGWNSLFNLSAGDYVEIVWHSDKTGVQLITIPATTGPVVPESPSLIVTIQALSQVGIGYYNETSTTSTTIGTGNKTFTVAIPATSTAFTVGTRVRVAYAVTPANFMEGVITAFTTTSMTVNVDSIGGSGTYANWTFSVAGIQGSNGVTSFNTRTGAVTLTSSDVTTALTYTPVQTVTGTSPVVSSGGTTPAISMPAATTSVSGYLTSTDWNTFNGKQAAGTYVNSVSGTTGRITSTGGVTPVIDLASGVATAGTTGSSTLIPVVTIDTYGRVTNITTAANPQGTVTSVTGTAPVVSSGGATPAISMAAATASVNGYLTSTDWTTFNNKSNTNGTVTSVAALTLGTTGTDLSSTVATGTTTPVITLQVPTASATNRGALSSTDWSTFNGKAPAVTYTSTYVPYGQGTTTPALSANFNYDPTLKTLTAPQIQASNGIILNTKSIASSFTIPSADNAMSAGPVTVASGQTVTVSSGSRWVVL